MPEKESSERFYVTTLVVKYSFQLWSGGEYKYPKKSVVINFKPKEEITNESIAKKVRAYDEETKGSILRISDIDKI